MPACTRQYTKVAIPIYLLALFSDLPSVPIECLLPSTHALCQFINLDIPNQGTLGCVLSPVVECEHFRLQ